MKPAASPYDRMLYLGQGLQIGRFWVPADDRGFANTGPIENHVLVFPALAIEISYSRRERMVAEPMLAMCYNRGCEYRRRALNPRGDLCWWIAYEDSLLARTTGEAEQQPFRHRRVPVPRDAFLVMRAIITELASGNKPDPLQLEDCAWWLMGRCLDTRRGLPRSNRQQERAVERARLFLAEHFRESISLSEIAQTACISPFHLSRLFHRIVGRRLHQYLVDLRLRESVREITHSSRSLTEIGLDLGFSSPSHFSSTFSKRLGMPPNHLRRHRWARRMLEEPRNFLKA